VSKAHPWGAFSIATDSALYSTSSQKSVAKNLQKREQDLSSSESLRYPEKLFPFI
jgi:hypothetical protein